MTKFELYNKRFYLLFLVALLLHGCIEPYEFEAETYENVLVLEANITNELKEQEIRLSRSFMVGEDAPVPETGALVRVMANNGDVHLFYEVAPGRYESEPFAAMPNVQYILSIGTNDGEYESNPVTLAQSSGIDNLYARRSTFNGDEGVALQVDNYNSQDAAKYYRYKYEETYKIISRYSHNYDLVPMNGWFVEVFKTKEETTCYNTVASNDFILASTTSLQENNLEGFLVRFIDNQNPIGSRRYSILVKQYALSPEAFAYYETLKKLSGSDNVFSQNQPGFVPGNVINLNDPEEKVVGMFNVSSFSSRRIYFNYEDFYGPGHSRPYFTDDCDIGAPLFDSPGAVDNLAGLLEIGWVKYLGHNYDPGEFEGPYNVVNAACVDCTLLGTNEVPEFWIEE